jgi:hypothetical protein
MSTWEFISSVFFPNDAGQFLGNFQLPGEERLGNYGVCCIFKTGKIGGGRLGGWFTARQEWTPLSGNRMEGERMLLNQRTETLLRFGVCTVS